MPNLLSIFAKKLHVNFFEQTVENLITWRYNCPHKNIQEKIEGEEIDVYCYQTDGNPRIICIGECKLRFENESNRIKQKEIIQLERKMKAANTFEEKRRRVSEQFIIKGFMISNAENMADDAWEYAETLGVKFVRVKMPPGWQMNPRWKISDGDIIILGSN